MSDSKQILIKKIDLFLRKYYLGKLLAGSLYFLGTLLGFWVISALLGNSFHLSVAFRTFIYFSFLIAFFVLFLWWIVVPCLGLLKIKKGISYEQAALLIGQKINGVDDHVINALQLTQLLDEQPDNVFLSEGVHQRMKQLSPISFQKAIEWKEYTKFLKYLFIPLFVIVLISLWNVNWLTTPAKQLIQYNTEFIPEAPFVFNINENSLKGVTNESFEIDVFLEGESLPETIEMVNENGRFLLKKVSLNHFKYDWNRLPSKNIFHLEAGIYHSKTYSIQSQYRSKWNDLKLLVKPPLYLKESKKVYDAQKSMVIPEGSHLTWSFDVKNADWLHFYWQDSTYNVEVVNNKVTIDFNLLKSQNYSFFLQQKGTIPSDTFSFEIRMLSDEYPRIELVENKDSLHPSQIYLLGEASDDYGIRSVVLHQIIHQGDQKEHLPIQQLLVQGKNTSISEVLNFDQYNLKEGQYLSYFIEVKDNDGVNGSKSVVSNSFIYTPLSKDYLDSLSNQKNQEQVAGMNSVFQQLKQLQKEWDETKNRFSQKKKLSWEDKLSLDQLLQKQLNLQKETKRLSKEMQDLQELAEQSEVDSSLLAKQEALKKLMESVLDDELKEKLEQLRKMLDELRPKDVLEQMENITEKNDVFEKELDRSLELFKQLEFDRQLEALEKEVAELKKSESSFQKKLNQPKVKKEELIKNQQEVKDAHKKVDEKLKEWDKLNKELEQKENLGQINKKNKEVEQAINESEEQTQKGKSKKTKAKQKQVEDKIDELEQQLGEMKDKREDNGVDIESMRHLLEKLLYASLSQEKIMQDLRKTPVKNPKYNDLARDQRQLYDQYLIMEDSLIAITKKSPGVAQVVFKESAEIKKNMQNSYKQMQNRRTAFAVRDDQRAMTSINNLLVMIDESLKQAQKNQAQSQKGKGQCKKGGGKSSGGKKASQSLGEMRKQLQKQLDKMQQMAKNKGQKPGGKKSGKKPGKGGQSGSAKSLVEMAAQQAQIQKQLDGLIQQLKGNGKEIGNGLQKIKKDLEKNEEDIVNKNITLESLHRQKDILSRLLKHEKALKEREWDDERESNEGKDLNIGTSNQYLEYIRWKEKQVELLRTLTPDYTEFYKEIINEYFNSIKE